MTAHDRPLTPDQRDILAVIEADLASFLARDKTAWERHWVADSRFHSIMECGTMQVAQGFDAFRSNVFEAMDAAPDPVDAEVRRENLSIDVRGDLAWARFDEVVTETSNPIAVPNLSHNFRLFERQAGTWRILFHGCWAVQGRDIASPAIEVGPKGNVVWMNAAAAERLATFGGLAVSHGRLRAARPGADTGLRETIARSHKLTGFGKFNEAAPATGESVTFPVVLGEDDDGALLTCWVRVADGRVFVLFGKSAGLSRQLDVASVLYGFSETQADLVRLIAEGDNLSEIAGKLGITKNTARTHLRRVFEKSGVGSQIELLRLLIGLGV